MGRGDQSEARRRLLELASLPDAGALAAVATYELAQLALRAGDLDEARARLDRLGSSGAADLAEPAAFLACEIDLRAGDLSAARGCYARFRARHPGSVQDAEALGALLPPRPRHPTAPRAAPSSTNTSPATRRAPSPPKPAAAARPAADDTVPSRRGPRGGRLAAVLAFALALVAAGCDTPGGRAGASPDAGADASMAPTHHLQHAGPERRRHLPRLLRRGRERPLPLLRTGATPTPDPATVPPSPAPGAMCRIIRDGDDRCALCPGPMTTSRR